MIGYVKEKKKKTSVKTIQNLILSIALPVIILVLWEWGAKSWEN